MTDAAARCPNCGDRHDTPGASAGVCYGCYLDRHLPDWYEGAEDYAVVALFRAGGQSLVTARRRPRTGLELLDAPSPPRIVDVLSGWCRNPGSPTARRLRGILERMAQREAAQGLTDDL